MPSNLLEEAHQTLNDVFQEFMSDPCIYRRGSQSVSLRVTRGKSLLRLTDERGGQRTELWDRDFFVPKADLILGGIVSEPLAGDTLDVTIGGKVGRYEVMQPDVSEQAARLTDSDIVWRIHTKQTGDVNG